MSLHRVMAEDQRFRPHHIAWAGESAKAIDPACTVVEPDHARNDAPRLTRSAPLEHSLTTLEKLTTPATGFCKHVVIHARFSLFMKDAGLTKTVKPVEDYAVELR